MEQVLKARPEVVREYFRLFVNRRAFTIQSKKPHPESGRHYYFRPKAKGTGKPISLSDRVLKQHWKERSPSHCTQSTPRPSAASG